WSSMRILRCRNLDDGGRSHSAACAHRRNTDSAAASAQFVDQGDEHPRARRGDGMAERATATAGIDLLRIEVEQLDGGDAHGRERLVDLEQVDVGTIKLL